MVANRNWIPDIPDGLVRLVDRMADLARRAAIADPSG
jgi:hypothetical protein